MIISFFIIIQEKMILTGSAIREEWKKGRIVIDPFLDENINPNSYNFRLGNQLSVYVEDLIDPQKENNLETIYIPEEGYVLEPNKLYLANTIEVLGSDFYAPTYNARSSVARLGMFINLSATLCDIGFKGQITMQLYSLNRVRVYPGMNIGQIMFWKPEGHIELYHGKYQGSNGPQASKIFMDFRKDILK